MTFLDTSGLLAVVDRRDEFHRPASEWFRRIAPRARLYTTDFVLDELLTGVAVLAGPERAGLLARELLADSRVAIVFVDRTIFEAGLAELDRYQDKQLSFTDCVSFAVMRALGIAEAFTFDDDFTRSGFVGVPAFPREVRSSRRRRR